MSTLPSIPCIAQLLSFLAGGASSFKVGNISKQEVLEKAALQIATTEFEVQHDLIEMAKLAVDENTDSCTFAFVRVAFAVLYRVAAIGVKLRPDDAVLYSYKDAPIIQGDLIGDETTVKVHPMLHRSLNVSDRKKQDFQAAA